MKKLRHRRVKYLALGHTADRQECSVGTLGDPTGCRPPHPLSLAIHLQSPCCSIKSEFLRTKRVHLMAAGLRGQGLAMECPPRLWLREHGLTDRPTPISCQPGSCSWAKLRDRSHTGLFVLGGNPSAPTAHLKGLLSQHQGDLSGARPSWETWHVGSSLATLPTGHSEPTQKLAPSVSLWRLEPRLQG